MGPEGKLGMASRPSDVLIVGAGPTGLTLAAQLQRFGTRFRIIDRSLDRARESRALAVQARTLELLDSVGLGEPLVARGRKGTRVALHSGSRTVGRVQLADIGASDTRFPFILFVSQAETERLIGDHLTRSGITIERGVELTRFEDQRDGVACVLRHQDGREEQVQAAYLVGCDGARSFVRKQAGFSFEGGSYPQDFVLADIEADGPLEDGAVNAFLGKRGAALFFPLGEPTTWRVIAMRAAGRSAEQQNGANADSPIGPLSLEELQGIVASPTEGSVRLHDPVWLTHFHLHHRQIAHYRSGRLFLAGDAAHIHSPVGGQGMNTGIQDAWNLGWKLALVLSGRAQLQLLDSYEAERWPVGKFLLRFTDRAFNIFTRTLSAGRIVTWVRDVIVPRVLPRVLASARIRRRAFRFVSELGIHYRESPAVREGEPAIKGGPRAGDRFPDATVQLNGEAIALQRAATGPCLTLLLCGDVEEWRTRLSTRFSSDDVLRVQYLSSRSEPGVLVDEDRTIFKMLGVNEAAQYHVRPDGYIAFRCAGYDLGAHERYLADWYLWR